MNKALALVLALCMMFAMGTVAFAAIDQSSKPEGNDPFIVQTTFDDADETYSVTIPADINIPWGAANVAYESSYTITSQLKTGATLTVTAVGTGKLGALIPYHLGGDTNVTTKTAVVDATSYTITATVPSFTGFSIATYTDTVTFTVSYNAPIIP